MCVTCQVPGTRHQVPYTLTILRYLFCIINTIIGWYQCYLPEYRHTGYHRAVAPSYLVPVSYHVPGIPVSTRYVQGTRGEHNSRLLCTRYVVLLLYTVSECSHARTIRLIITAADYCCTSTYVELYRFRLTKKPGIQRAFTGAAITYQVLISGKVCRSQYSSVYGPRVLVSTRVPGCPLFHLGNPEYSGTWVPAVSRWKPRRCRLPLCAAAPCTKLCTGRVWDVCRQFQPYTWTQTNPTPGLTLTRTPTRGGLEVGKDSHLWWRFAKKTSSRKTRLDQ